MPRTASDQKMAERWRKHARDLEKELGDPRKSGMARYAKKILKGDEAFWLWTALTTDIALWQLARAEAEAESRVTETHLERLQAGTDVAQAQGRAKHIRDLRARLVDPVLACWDGDSESRLLEGNSDIDWVDGLYREVIDEAQARYRNEDKEAR